LWVECKTKAGTRTIRISPVLKPDMRKLAEGKQPSDLLFGKHCYRWVRQWVKRLGRRAGVPEVTAHGLRGSHGTFTEESGETSLAVARTLAHGSPRTTHKHYTMRSAVESAKQNRVLKALAGGRQ
jgi:integrase